MRTWIWIAIAVAVVAAVTVVVLLHRPAAAPAEFKVGVIMPLTGDGAAYGKEELNGIELATEEFNATAQPGGIRLALIVEDSQGKPATATAAAQKLISQAKVAVIIGDAFSSPTLAIVPIADRNHVLVISPTASSPKLSGASRYFFRVWPSDTAEGESIAEVAVDRLHLKKIAILYVNNEYGLGLKDVFDRTVKSKGCEVVLADAFPEGQTDFRTTLAKIKALSPDGVYIPGYYKEVTVLLRQAKELGLQTQFLGSATFNEPQTLALAGAAAEGVIFVQPQFDIKSQEPAIQKFAADYEKRVGAPAGIYAAHAYDATRVLTVALDQGARTPDDIRAKLLSLRDFPGVTGATTFLPSGDCEKPVRVMAVRNGQFTNWP